MASHIQRERCAVDWCARPDPDVVIENLGERFQLQRRAESIAIVARSMVALTTTWGLLVFSLKNQRVPKSCAVGSCAVDSCSANVPITIRPMTTTTSVTRFTKPANGRLILGRSCRYNRRCKTYLQNHKQRESAEPSIARETSGCRLARPHRWLGPRESCRSPINCL